MGIASTKHRLFSGNYETAIPEAPPPPPPLPPPPPKDNNNDNKALTTAATTKKNQHNQVVPKRSPLLAVYALTPTHKGFFRRPFAPLSPAQHIKAVLARWHGTSKAKAAAAAAGEGGEEGEENVRLNKNFGFLKHIRRKYELGDEVGRGHFGHTCKSKVKCGEQKGQPVAIKIIPKSKMTTSIAIEDVKREVKILRLLTGHSNLVTFYDAYEDHDNVYLVMELCEGGVLLDRIIARGGKFTEDDAKKLMIQMLTVVAFCHLQGVVHRDLKPENFLFATKDEDAELKAIDFGLSDFVNPEERLDDIVGSAYYVAPEVLQRSYGTEADVWSVGVIAYALLCGSRPFWGRTESGIFRAVLKNQPSYDPASWSNLSVQAKSFVQTLLNKDPKKRLTAAQALCHPWIRNGNQVKKPPFDIWIPKFVKRYICSSNLRKSALRALSKTLTSDQMVYLKEQFSLLEPKNGYINVESFKTAVTKNATGAMKESCIHDFLASVCKLQYKKMDLEEFCAAALRVHQLESRDGWQEQTHAAYQIFENDGNRSIMVEELASELGLGPSIRVRDVLDDLIRPTDGKLTYVGFIKVLRGYVSRRSNTSKS